MHVFPYFILFFLLFSCVEPMPKPRGLLRIEPPQPYYASIQEEELPFCFEVSQLVTFDAKSAHEVDLNYNSLNVTVYCTYRPITAQSFPEVDRECRELLMHASKRSGVVSEQAFERSEKSVYARLFHLGGESVSPIQFLLTDSVRHFFRGAMYYRCEVDVDSLAPVTDYLYDDIKVLIETFQWN